MLSLDRNVKVHPPIIRRTFLLFDSPMQHDAKSRSNSSSMMMVISSLHCYPKIQKLPANFQNVCWLGFETCHVSQNNYIR